MIDNEMSCSPNPQWLKDFKQEIQEEFNLTSLDATCIAGKVAKIVRKRDEKACEWLCQNVAIYVDTQGCVDIYELESDFCKAKEE